MSHARLRQLRERSRAQVLAQVAGFAVPWLAAATSVALRIGNASWWLVAGVLVLSVAVAVRRWRALDLEGVARGLDARHPALEDSTALLLEPEDLLGPLARLQRERVATRLAALSPPPRLVAPTPWRALTVSALAALALGVAAQVLHWHGATPEPSPASVAPVRAPLPPGLRAAELRITPPSYTGLPASRVEGLGARVPEGAGVQWRLRMQGAPERVALRFHDGSLQPLARERDEWVATRRIDRATLYRLQVDGRESAWQRVGVIGDRAPRLRVLAPERSLSLIEPGQARWALDIEASDDYGLGAAQLRVTLAQGSGENIKVSAREITLAGQGDRRARRYRHTLDLAALGFAAGDDLVVRLSVTDNRAPLAQRTHSPSFILRWPPEIGAQASGVEGMVQKTLPAYFRSQRQIIIDTEALLAMKPRPAADEWMTRSNAIGVDQRVLRLRYGQFLGEEAEDDAPGEGEDHAPAAQGDAAALVQQFGHTHDIPEAATLLDPQTRKLLKAALDAMWSAEGELRLGKPREALPHEYRALRLVKQVQQASRIYLARVGLEQAPVDMSRRLNGKREGIQPGSPRSEPVPRDERAPARALWDALAGGDARAARAAADALEQSVGAQAEASDTLALLAALDAWRADPRCAHCVERLRARLWPRLPVPPPAVAPRVLPDARARAYLEALGREDRP